MHRSALRRLGPLLVSVALLSAACGGGTDTVADDATATDSDTVADDATATDSDTVAVWPHTWTAELLGGGQFDAGDFAGQDLVLWFWAPW